MPQRQRRSAGLACTILFTTIAVGCPSQPSKPVAPATGGSTGVAAKTGGELAPDSPAAEVSKVLRELSQNRPDALWAFLPRGFQNDVNGLIHDFAARMDRDLWNRAVAVLTKLSATLRSQEALLRETYPTAAEARVMDFAGVSQLIEVLLASELGDLERMRTADLGQFLETTGREMFRQTGAAAHLAPQVSLPAALAQAKITQKSSDGDQALLVIELPGEAPRETAFVRVDGKWIPRDLAEDWIEWMGQARARLAVLSPENFAESKPQWLGLLDAIDAALDQLAQAKNRTEVEAAVTRALEAALPFATGFMSPAAAADAPPQPAGASRATTGELVAITIRGRLEPVAQQRLLEQLKRAVPGTRPPAGEYTGDDEITIFRVGPIDDVEAFAAELRFLQNVRVNAAERRIDAESLTE